VACWLRDARRHAGERVRPQALLAGQLPQQAQQLRPLGIAQAGPDPGLVFRCGRPDPLQHCSAGLGQVQRVRPAVAWIAPALDQAEPFQFIDQEYHAGRVHPDQLGDGLLGLALVPGEAVQHPGVALLQAQRRQPLPELPRRMETQLDEQERDAVGRVE